MLQFVKDPQIIILKFDETANVCKLPPAVTPAIKVLK